MDAIPLAGGRERPSDAARAMGANIGASRSCPAGTTFRWRFASQQGTGGFSGYSSWYTSAGSKYARNVPFGASGGVRVNYFCDGAYADSPQAYSNARTSVRPYPAPYSFSVWGDAMKLCSPGSSGGGGFSARAYWSTSAYANSYNMNVSYQALNGSRGSLNQGTVSGGFRGVSYTGPTAYNPMVRADMTARNSSGTRSAAGPLSVGSGGCGNG